MACNEKRALFTSEQPKMCGHVRKFVMLSIIFWTILIFIRYGSKLYRQIVEILMGTNCAPLVADFFLCYERVFMLSLSDENQADVVKALNTTSRYLDDLFNIDNPYFEQMVSQMNPLNYS